MKNKPDYKSITAEQVKNLQISKPTNFQKYLAAYESPMDKIFKEINNKTNDSLLKEIERVSELEQIDPTKSIPEKAELLALKGYKIDQEVQGPYSCGGNDYEVYYKVKLVKEANHGNN